MASMFMTYDKAEDKNHTPEREIVLRPMEGKKATSSTGMVDTRLFKGTNKLNAIMGEDGLWFCRYDDGNLPEPLKMKFTSISKLLAHVRPYYERRNIEIVEVKNKE